MKIVNFTISTVADLIKDEEATDSQVLTEKAAQNVNEPLVTTERIEHLHIMTIAMNRAKKVLDLFENYFGPDYFWG